MPHLITPSSSFSGADGINNPVPNDDTLLTKNRMLLLELEQKPILPPGILTISPSGELKADLSTDKRPDQGTMAAGLHPNHPRPPPPEAPLEHQVPSWLRDYLLKELDLFGRGPPSSCRALYDQMGAGRSPSVRAAALLLSCAARLLRRSVDELRDFVRGGEAVCDESYGMEFGMVEGIVGRLVGCVHGAGREKEKVPRDVRLLLEIGGMGRGMKSALDISLEEVVIEPVVRLIEKLEYVAEGLRRLQGGDEGRKDGEGGDVSDSGVSGCSS